ncbi:30S ribosome-binding factor RbfA [Candidatus Neptunochlamydia vexilliferae]|uniref:30S ribosome-binding factor RbfA n=1 Tax=Candidatus Neptunichlamydia vexilliferae TaxID=1651774 RepID=UPI001891A83F|nr:30S ribosome-binding factor RbfA [Candidatus Neptunochlamydia vexilliferae]
MTRRTERLNSLLKEVITEVIRKDVRNPKVSEFTTVTEVDISKDLHHAKVYISIIGNDEQRKGTVEALESAAGFIGVHASKKVVMHHFPTLTFRLDTSVDKQMKIDSLLKKIHEEEASRKNHE